MSIYQHIPDHIKRVSKAVGCALWLDTFDNWEGLSLILRARLDAQQRAALAFMVLKSLDRNEATLTAQAALSEGAGSPIAPFFSYMDEAAFWADMAAPDELDAYCLASFTRMPSARQSAFLGFVQGREVA